MLMKIILLLIPLMPLLGFLVLGIGMRRVPRRVAAVIGPGTVLASFVMSVWMLTTLYNPELPPVRVVFYYDWLSFGTMLIPFSFLFDPLSSLMTLVVTGVGFVIHLYSVGYMKEDPGFNRFFAFMNLFVFSMLILVLGSNLPLMFIGWEGVGLCSYLLIGFWFKNREYGNAAKKAFIMNRIGDLGMLLGMFLIFTNFNTLTFHEIAAAVKPLRPGLPVITAITLLLFVGAVGKSAQIPLFTWLPDAMAGPTPVSALIHAATMVTAGVYMVARTGALFVLAPFTMELISVIGLATALFAGMIAVFQNDIKKVLAYSTISQLGYMFLGLGAGAFTGAMFHLVTHAFFKALLFLGAGSVIHAMGGEQDIRRMGGLSRRMPQTYITFLAGTLAIAGIPPLSGFFSKDEILLHVAGHSVSLWALGAVGALLTAFYMFRLLFLVFGGVFRGTEEEHHHLHESPAVMTLPLLILAILTVIAGVLNLPEALGGNGRLTSFLSPVLAGAERTMALSVPMELSTEMLFMGITLLGSIGAAVFAWYRFRRGGHGLLPDDAPRSLFARLAIRKFYVDELYERLITRPLDCLSRLLHEWVELRFIDRIVNGAGNLAVWTGNTLRYIQAGNVGFYMFMMILGIILILFFNILI